MSGAVFLNQCMSIQGEEAAESARHVNRTRLNRPRPRGLGQKESTEHPTEDDRRSHGEEEDEEGKSRETPLPQGLRRRVSAMSAGAGRRAAGGNVPDMVAALKSVEKAIHYQCSLLENVGRSTVAFTVDTETSTPKSTDSKAGDAGSGKDSDSGLSKAGEVEVTKEADADGNASKAVEAVVTKQPRSRERSVHRSQNSLVTSPSSGDMQKISYIPASTYTAFSASPLNANYMPIRGDKVRLVFYGHNLKIARISSKD